MSQFADAGKGEDDEFLNHIINLLQRAPISMDEVKNDERSRCALEKLVSEGKVEIVYRLKGHRGSRKRIYLLGV